MLTQIYDRYMVAIKDSSSMRPEDLGAVRLAMKMALDELQRGHREMLNEMDGIVADLLRERDELRKSAQTDAGEILRLQTMEDRLIRWAAEHAPVAEGTDIADALIALLSKRGGETVAPPPAPSGNGHDAPAKPMRYSGRRVDMPDDEIRTLAVDTLRTLADELGRTPTKREYEQSVGNGVNPSFVTIKARTGMSWNDLIVAAGLEPNLNIAERKAAAKAKEAEPENGTPNFRG